MAFKEYSKNDFFYYKFGTTDASCNNTIELDDLIDSSCRSYTAEPFKITINSVEYQVTPNMNINTIREIADDFTKKSPYIFSYKGNKLVIESAKIKFEPTADTKAATAYYKLADMMTALANADKTTKDAALTAAATAAKDAKDAAATAANSDAKTATDAANSDATAANSDAKTATAAKTAAKTATAAAEAYKIASKFLGYEESDVINHKLPYMFPNTIKTTYNDDKKVQEYNFDNSYMFGNVDIRANNSNRYYETSRISIIIPTNDTDVRYINPYSLIEHLNHKKIGFVASASPVTLTADPNNKLYYKFEYVSTYDKLKVDLICEESSTFTNSNTLTIKIDNNTYEFTKGLVDYKVSYGTNEPESMKGVDNVFKLLPDFALTFTDITITTGKLVYSASKYVKYNGKYYTLPYQLPDGPTVTDQSDISPCNTAKQNKALCTNKTYAEQLMALTGTHPGASERYDNIRGFTNMSILNIFNLGIGIVATGVFIAQTYK